MPSSQERTDGREAVAFDFRAAVAGDPRLRVVTTAHEPFRKRAAVQLARSLRSAVEVQLLATEQAPVGDYLRSLPRVTVVVELSVEGSDAPIWLELSPQLALVMVERALGGPGSAAELRPLSRVEQAILQDTIVVLAETLADALEPAGVRITGIERIVQEPSALHAADPHHRVTLVVHRVAMQVAGGTVEGLLTLVEPAAVLDRLAPRPPAVPAVTPADGPLARRLPEVAVDLRARLRPTALPAASLAALRVGDVVTLAHRVDEPVVASVAGVEVLRAHLGQRAGSVALRVDDLVTGGAHRPARDEPTPAGDGHQLPPAPQALAGDLRGDAHVR